MQFRWEARCKFKNGFMQQHGTTCTVTVTAEKQADAEKTAQLKACDKFGVSTMMHRYVKVSEIKNAGRA